jgi:hypothetical protein
MGMISMAPDKKWSSLTARERTLLRALGDPPGRAACGGVYGHLPPSGRGDTRQQVAVEHGVVGELHGHRPYRLFRLRSEARLVGLELEREE